MASPSSPASPACDRELAGRAQDYFEGLEYDKALETLETLSKARANDPKVAHNLAVARFYAGRDKSTESFFEVAVAAKRRVSCFPPSSSLAAAALPPTCHDAPLGPPESRAGLVVPRAPEAAPGRSAGALHCRGALNGTARHPPRCSWRGTANR